MAASESVLRVAAYEGDVPTDRSAIPALTARERQWYAAAERFETAQSIVQAAVSGKLVRVVPDHNTTPVAKLRNTDGEWERQFTPFLLPGSAIALQVIGELWRQELKATAIDRDDLRLSVTSLARSEQRQREIVKDPSKFASEESVHCVGAAFDIDAAGYYVVTHDKAGYTPVMHPDRNPEDTTKQLRAVDATGGYPMPQSDEAYNPAVTDALISVTDRLHQLGVINRIVEYQGDKNQCVHIAPNPEIAWQLPMVIPPLALQA